MRNKEGLSNELHYRECSSGIKEKEKSAALSDNEKQVRTRGRVPVSVSMKIYRNFKTSRNELRNRNRTDKFAEAQEI